MSRTPRLSEPGSADSASSPLLPSRDHAHEALKTALDAAPGLFVLTGDAGGGKTWLRRKVAAEQAYPWVWVELNILPSDNSEGFHRKIARALGIDDAAPETWLDFLADRSRDGERHVLVVEEAHNLTPALLEEVRVTAGLEVFGLILLVGQTSLARRLGSPAYRSFVSRVTGAAHLPPIDADEAQILLDEAYPSRGFTPEEVEALHCEAWGEPRRLLKLAKTRETAFSRVVAELGGPRPVERFEPRPKATPSPTPPPPPTSSPIRPAPLLGPGRPPLRVEEGLIEVGWSPDLEAQEEDAGGETVSTASSFSGPQTDAIEAWTEWAREHGRGPVEEAPADDFDTPSTIDRELPDVRPEPGREFAPKVPHFGRVPAVEDLDS